MAARHRNVTISARVQLIEVDGGGDLGGQRAGHGRVAVEQLDGERDVDRRARAGVGVGAEGDVAQTVDVIGGGVVIEAVGARDGVAEGIAVGVVGVERAVDVGAAARADGEVLGERHVVDVRVAVGGAGIAQIGQERGGVKLHGIARGHVDDDILTRHADDHTAGEGDVADEGAAVGAGAVLLGVQLEGDADRLDRGGDGGLDPPKKSRSRAAGSDERCETRETSS